MKGNGKAAQISTNECLYYIYIFALLCAPMKVLPVMPIRVAVAFALLINNPVRMKNIVVPAITFFVYSLFFFIQDNFGRDFFDPFDNYMKIVGIFEISVVGSSLLYTSDKTKGRLVKAAFWAICISIVTSSFYILKDVDAIRYRNSDYTYIMGFYQFYGYILLPLSLVVLIAYGVANRKKVKGLIIVLALVFFLMLKGHLITGMLLGFVGFFLGIYCIYTKKGKTIFLSLGFLAIIALVLKDYIAKSILFLIYRFHIEGIVQKRLLSVVNIINANDLLDSYGSRGMLIRRSFSSFMKCPFTGVGYSGYSQDTVGCHSEWVDTLAVYGLIGSILILACFISIINSNRKILKDVMGKKIYFLTLFLFTVLGFLNPSFELPIMGVVFIVVPCISYYYEEG